MVTTVHPSESVRVSRDPRLSIGSIAKQYPALILSTSARSAVIRYLRRLVHLTSDPMTGIVTNNAVAVFLSMLLDRPTDIADPVSRPALLDTEFQALVRHADELLQARR